MRARQAARLFLLLLLAICNRRFGVGQQPAQEVAALLSLPAACSNWAAASANLPGAPWQEGTDPCGAADGSTEAWKGVQCSAGGNVTEVVLSGLGLIGTLPAQLSAVVSLKRLVLDGNKLQGMLPMPQWTDRTAFTGGSTIVELRPGNPGLCGPVMPLDPQLFPEGNLDRNATLIPAANLMHTGEQMTTLILTQRDLLSPGTSVTVTNWLGSCMIPCDQVTNGLTQAPPGVAAARLPWPPAITTNIFDLSWTYNMTMADLVQLNPDAAWMQSGEISRLPCYPSKGNIPFAYYGGDVAFGQFSGGNQLPGAKGLPAAMAAARLNANIPNTFHWPSIYTGTPAPDELGGGIVQPVYWFVDLLANYHVSNVLVTAGGPTSNASIFIGTDSTSVVANTLVAAGINLAAGQQLAFAGKGVLGRYVIFYTGMADEGIMSLDDIQVYTYEANAAYRKPVTASELSSNSSAGTTAISGSQRDFSSLEALVDNNVSTCVWLQGGTDNSPAYATVDLGYVGAVGSVVAVTGPDVALGTQSRAYVTQTADEPLTDAAACSSEGRELSPGTWTVGACNRQGRYITFQLPDTEGEARVELCELQVAITLRPEPPGSGNSTLSGSSSSSISGGAIAGIVVGGLAALALLSLLAAYLWWRQRRLRQQRGRAALGGAQGYDQDAWDRQHAEDLKGGSSNGNKPPVDNGGGKGGQKAAAVPLSATDVAGGYGGMNGKDVEDVEAAAAAAEGKPGVGAAKDGKKGDSKGAQRRRRGYVSELALMREFVRALLGRRTLEDFSGNLMQRSKTASAFSISREHGTVGKADTDLSKLPSGFSEVSPADIQLVEIVGEGSFGEVWLAKYCGALVAVKILAKIGSDNMTSSIQNDLLLRSLKKEALLMSKLRHPNVCLYLGACTEPPSLVFEYCAKSSLDMLLRAGIRHPQMARRLTWPRLLGIALDGAKGMLYLHTRAPPVAHRDLKSANILVDSQWHAKVADFSLSRAIEVNTRASTVVVTNPRWLAPEVLNGMPGQLPADVWAFGTVMWELMTWRLPFEDLNTFQIISTVQRTGTSGLAVPPAEELAAGSFTCYPQYVALMQACWAQEPAARPKFGAIVEQLSLMLAAELAPQQAAAAAAASEMPSAQRSPPRMPSSSVPPPIARPSPGRVKSKAQGGSSRRATARVAPAGGPGSSTKASSGSAGGTGGLAAVLPPGIPKGEDPGNVPRDSSESGAAAATTVDRRGAGPPVPPPSAVESGGSGSRQGTSSFQLPSLPPG